MLIAGLVRQYCVLMPAACAIAGCVSTVASAPPASVATPRDLAFITELTKVVAFDRTLIREELSRPGDPRVKALASDLLEQAEGIDAKVRPIAERDGIQPPDAVMIERAADRHARLATPETAGRTDYDEAFLESEILSHEQAVAAVDTFIHQPSGDPALQKLSVEGIIRLRFNLQRLEALQKAHQSARAT